MLSRATSFADLFICALAKNGRVNKETSSIRITKILLIGVLDCFGAFLKLSFMSRKSSYKMMSGNLNRHDHFKLFIANIINMKGNIKISLTKNPLY